ncbi:MAG: TauD/TfdA family dioxygenase [Alphaproteobacteria bacterium]|nr:TauD/TfdA family dioxygenase [Alphaproteobacteria bacterium]
MATIAFVTVDSLRSCALAVPSRGGNTLFADGYAAYDALPALLKERLEGVIETFSYAGPRGKSKLLNREDQDWTPVYHSITEPTRKPAADRCISTPARSSALSASRIARATN